MDGCGVVAVAVAVARRSVLWDCSLLVESEVGEVDWIVREEMVCSCRRY
jgi:hypothetical protein